VIEEVVIVPSGRCRLDIGTETIEFNWGRSDGLGTASFWIDQTRRRGYEQRVADECEGRDLRDHVVFCLLGGYGVRAESAAAAFHAIRPLIAETPQPSERDLEHALRQPLEIRPGHSVRYRFWRQRAERIAGALEHLAKNDLPSEPVRLRDHLMAISGVGPKTASWIVRNATGSDDVAIIDIWLVRALSAAGVFPTDWDVRRDYSRYEMTFLAYSNEGGVPASALDWCIWDLGRSILPHLH